MPDIKICSLKIRGIEFCIRFKIIKDEIQIHSMFYKRKNFYPLIDAGLLIVAAQILKEKYVLKTLTEIK
jgi:hypothetical protein